MILLKQGSYIVHEKGGILITGFPSQIATSLAKKLIENGYIVFAGFKDMNLNTQMSQDLQSSWIPVHLDVTNQGMINRAAQKIRCKLADLPLVGIVHCAGTIAVGPLEFLSKEDMMQVFSVNTIGPCLVTSSMLDLLRESQGRIIFMSSVSGWCASPLNSSFGASKIALESIADSLRIELSKFNISVSLIELGIFKLLLSLGSMNTLYTENLKSQTQNLFNSKSSINYGPLISSISQILQNTRPLSLGYSTRALMHALFSSYPKTRYFVGWDARATWLLRSFLPDRILDAMYTSSIASFEKDDITSDDIISNSVSDYGLNMKKQF